ncbi:MAG: type II toxin-antitoxin system YafQ family toxin [Prevotellaceae bacterium]|jgi:mRNA interferase YafQ|nr:type II toxin-antitoxin system YafQ family toxin [Prevotellaceae bacterium]
MNDTPKKKRKTRKEFFRSLAEKEGFVYHLIASNTFKKDIDLCYKRNLDLDLLENVVTTLARGENLEEKYRSHKLYGISKASNEEIWECHVQPDWLLIWKQNDIELVLVLSNSGTHSDLF